MLPVGVEFRNMFKDNNRFVNLKLTVIGTATETYYNSEVVDFEMTSNNMSDDAFSIGNFIANQIEFKLRVPLNQVQDNSIVKVAVGIDVTDADPSYDDWTETTNLWLEDSVVYTNFGEYYVTDITDSQNKYITVTALDKSIVTHRDYESVLTYPATMREVASEIEVMSGIVLDDDFLTTIPSSYTISLMPTVETYQSILGYIAGACGGNIVMNEDGKASLRLFSKSETSSENISMGQYYSLTSLGDDVTLTAVRLYESDDYTEGEYNETTLGSGDERDTLDIYNPFVNETIHQDLYDRFNGFTYRPASVSYIGFPQLEVGDMVSISTDVSIAWEDAYMTWLLADFTWDSELEDVNLYIFEHVLSIKGGMRGQFKSSPMSEQNVSDVYGTGLSTYIQKIDQSTLKESIPYNGVTTSRSEGVVVERSDGLAKAVLNATEGLSLYSDTGSGLEKNFYAGVDGYLYANRIKIGGDSTVDGLGDVAYLDTLTSTYIEDGAITTGKIAAGSITANEISTDAITASKIDVDSLSVISTDIGTVTAGTLSGVVYYTAGGTSDRIAIGETLSAQSIQWQNNGSTVVAQIAGVANDGYLQLSADGQIAIIADDDIDLDGFDIRIDASDDLTLSCNDTLIISTNDNMLISAPNDITIDGNLLPSGSGDSLGTSSDRWSSLNVSGTGYFGGSLFGGNVYSDTISTRAVFVRSDGKLGTESSTIRFKDDVENYEFDYDALMSLPVVSFKYKKEINNDGIVHHGTIAEWANDLGLKEFVGRDKNGLIDFFDYSKLNIANLQLIQTQHKMITELEKRIARLEK